MEKEESWEMGFIQTCLWRRFKGLVDEVVMERFSFGKEEDHESEVGFPFFVEINSEERVRDNGGFE